MNSESIKWHLLGKVIYKAQEVLARLESGV